MMDDSIDTHSSAEKSRDSDNEGREERGRSNELTGWDYSSQLQQISIDIDGINKMLGRRFVSETHSIPQKVGNEAKQKGSKTFTAASISQLDEFDLFLPEHVLLKIVSNVNRILRLTSQKETDAFEFKGVLVLHILAASYNFTVETITKKRIHQFLFQMNIPSTRYSQIWSALSSTPDRRQRVENGDGGWFNYQQRANDLIAEPEDELASVIRLLLYVPGVTIFSLDDDHQRLRSRADAQMTILSQVNNPQKALGPVNNAMFSALTHVFLASHYSRQGEKVTDVWERFIRLIQGVPTFGPVGPMVDAKFASDRGYNSKATVKYINERVGATGIGTHKLNTVDASIQRMHDHSAVSNLMKVGQNEASTKFFHERVPSTKYRIQCLHHAVSLSLKQVMFVPAKGSKLGVGGVINAAIVHFHRTLTTIYSYLLAALRVGMFPWIGKDASKITSMYDDLLQTSHASDLNSYASYYSLNQAYRSLAPRDSTLPPGQMIRPTAFIYWNYLKGGVDEFSRAMTTMCYTIVGESPIVSIIGRLLCAQVQSGAVVHRLSLARYKHVILLNMMQTVPKGTEK